MSRTIISKSEVAALNTTPDPDRYVSMIIKLIPVEIVSVYQAAYHIIDSSKYEDEKQVLQWVTFVALLLITPFYLKKVAQITSNKQIVFCTISFVVWVFSLGGPFTDIGAISPQFLGAVFLPVYTLLIPLVYD